MQFRAANNLAVRKSLMLEDKGVRGRWVSSYSHTRSVLHYIPNRRELSI